MAPSKLQIAEWNFVVHFQFVRQGIKVQHHGQGGGVPRPVGYATGRLSVEGETEGST